MKREKYTRQIMLLRSECSKLEGRQFILLEDLPSNKNPKPLLDKKNF